MLKEFRVTNYKSIKSEQIFTMEACPTNVISEHPEHVLQIGNERLLKVASFYGPNGGGKSNLMSALAMVFQVVFGIDILTGAIGDDNYYPYLLNNDKTSKFDLFIIKDGMEIGYSLVVDLSKTKKKIFGNNIANIVETSIKNEEMVYKSLSDADYNVLFNRNESGLVNSDILSNIDLIASKRALPPKSSFIKYIIDSFSVNNVDEKIRPIINFGVELSNIYVLNREDVHYFFTKDYVDELTPFLPKTTELLNGFDLRIVGLHFQEVEPDKYCLYLDRKTEDGSLFSIQLSSESSGTKKAINTIFGVLSSKNSSIFVADDFDSRLHPKLVRTLIELFTSSENKTKQLILNSHDVVNMNNEVFRRDEIWFAHRNNDFATEYIPLSNIVDYKGNMVRKDAVYGKQYLEGRYGADPFIKKGLEWPK